MIIIGTIITSIAIIITGIYIYIRYNNTNIDNDDNESDITLYDSDGDPIPRLINLD